MSDALEFGSGLDQETNERLSMGFDGGFDLPEARGFQTAATPDFTVQANGESFNEEEEEEEDLWAGTLDHEADTKAIKASLPPAGYYEVKLNAGTRSVREVEGRKRPTLRYNGLGIRYADGVESKARIRFSICHVAFTKANGKQSWDYQMYLSAKKAYFTANQVNPQTIDDLDEFLSTATVKARITHTDDDYMVVGLEGVRA